MVSFVPNFDIFYSGTNPYFLIDNLYELGTAQVYADTQKIPAIDELKATDCYTGWKIVLSTNKPEGEIRDVFMFVEGDSKIDILMISDNDLFKNKSELENILSLYGLDATTEITELKHVSEKINSETKNTLEEKYEEKQEIEKEVEVSGQSEDTIEKRQLNSVSSQRTSSIKENKITSVRVSSEKLDGLMNLVSELVTTQARLSMLADTSEDMGVAAIAEDVQKLTRQLRDLTFSVCLIPLQSILTRFQRLVRDLSSELKKDVDLQIEGAETELDKTIIENLADPVMHIIRNSMDHGIEDAETRKKLGKSKQGLIKIKAFYSGSDVILEISDDGAGINADKVRAKAISRGLISEESSLSKKEIIDLLFLPGFSTAEKITSVSGRGVGMDVVRRKITEIRGEVEIDAEVNKGTTITIKLPLTLSIIDGLLVDIDEVSYIIPLSVIDKCYAVEHSKVMRAYNNIIILDGVQIPFYYLRGEFESTGTAPTVEQIVVVRYNESRVGLIIDRVVGEYQAVLKPLGKMYKEQDMISGASILGDGTIALVMDTNRIVKKFSKQEFV